LNRLKADGRLIPQLSYRMNCGCWQIQRVLVLFRLGILPLAAHAIRPVLITRQAVQRAGDGGMTQVAGLTALQPWTIALATLWTGRLSAVLARPQSSASVGLIAFGIGHGRSPVGGGSAP